MASAIHPPEPPVERESRKYFAALLIGLGCAIICFIFSVYPATLRPYVYVPLAILLALLAARFSYLYPRQRWYLWLLLILPYVALMLWIVIATIDSNARWEGVFWRSEVYWSTIYLFVCPIVSSLLALLFGSHHRFRFALALIVLLVLALKCEFYITNNSLFAVSVDRSVEISNDSSRLQIDFQCKYNKSINYLSFTYSDGGGCGGASVVKVITKNAVQGLTSDAVWLIDGNEKTVRMSPMPGEDGVSIVGNFEPHKYDAVRMWSTDVPISSIAKARDVGFRWGDIHIQLQPEQIEAVRQTAMEFEGKLKKL